MRGFTHEVPISGHDEPVGSYDKAVSSPDMPVRRRSNNERYQPEWHHHDHHLLYCKHRLLLGISFLTSSSIATARLLNGALNSITNNRRATERRQRVPESACAPLVRNQTFRSAETSVLRRSRALLDKTLGPD
jgi:hypothetical protein